MHCLGNSFFGREFAAHHLVNHHPQGFFGVPVEAGTIAGLDIVGTCGIVTNKGGLVHIDATDEEIEKRKGSRYFLRAITRWGGRDYHTRTTGPQGSAILKSMALANSLVILPEEIEKVKKGEKVKVRFF